ncbi:replication initiation factor domain-containing protein [Streptococcus infantis]|uniref:replication initiation factor domain-containing protein n=1 Tax=Streptococcus infantis TaxID=68892 RepID=UPI0021629A83|nr:replication initiation factor domain-containing protein [Streptococcus infantis]
MKRLDIALDELYKGYGHEEEQIQIPKLIDKLYSKEIVLDTIKKWNITVVDLSQIMKTWKRITGLSIYFGSRQSQLYFNFYEKRYEIARMENISLDESLEIFGIWNRYELRFFRSESSRHCRGIHQRCRSRRIARGIINKEIQVYDGVTRFGAYNLMKNGNGSLEVSNLKALNQPTALQY